MKKTSRTVFGIRLAGGLACLASAAQAALIVVGGSVEAEGNTNNRFPFSIPSGTSMRYQQVYAASAFGALSEPSLITQFAFRPEALVRGNSATRVPNIQINLSTTAAAPDGLSPLFASNVGSDDTTVFSGELTLSTARTGPEDGPKDFDIVIDLTTPFLYDPAAGSLLLDVRNFSGSTASSFLLDAQEVVGDAVSRQYTAFGSSVNAPTAGGAGTTVGLVTRFTFAPIPEPGTALFGAACLGVMAVSRRRNAAR